MEARTARRGMETSGPDDKVSMHALRHFAASSWLAGGASIKDVAEYLGHANAGFHSRRVRPPDAVSGRQGASRYGRVAGRMCPGCARAGRSSGELAGLDLAAHEVAHHAVALDGSFNRTDQLVDPR